MLATQPTKSAIPPVYSCLSVGYIFFLHLWAVFASLPIPVPLPTCMQPWWSYFLLGLLYCILYRHVCDCDDRLLSAIATALNWQVENQNVMYKGFRSCRLLKPAQLAQLARLCVLQIQDPLCLIGSKCLRSLRPCHDVIPM